MTVDALLMVAGPGAAAQEAFGVLTIDVAPDRWVQVATAMRDDPDSDMRFFDWLSAYDDGEAGLAVVVRLWSVRRREGVLLRTHVERDGGELPSLTPVWVGADWHERETFEMFGISFAGHPHLLPLLLPDGFEGNPLRKEFVLATRVAKEWPGEKEPGGASEQTRRKPLQPPGVPAPGTWGPST